MPVILEPEKKKSHKIQTIKVLVTESTDILIHTVQT